MNTTQKIIDEIKDLPTEDLHKIQHAINEMLYQPDPDIEQAWIKESRRRLQEMKSGKVETIPGEQVMEELKKITGESS